ncbi:condensation domain-containing protein [Streptomyces echinoruber]|uniref:Condensation domain-containing protein n=1 Tax=Streptomyces echinoruber TaxID=68898 RepID=A0A918V599_9ACTN|nr:condensation domain-containing protein [Streptomyces echinoruber]GGZ70776.1 hypothetical protein GCM10010389_05350 [Streptomyces echinoruber]
MTGWEEAPCARSQQRFLLEEGLAPGQDDNHVVLAYLLTGPLDPAALAAAFDDVVRRHGILRTLYSWDADPGPVQRELPFDPARTPLTVVPVADTTRPVCEIAAEVCADWWDQPFDLEGRPPLRARLARLTGSSWLLCLSLHHIAFDGRSELVLMADLGAAYRAQSEGRTPDPAAVHSYQDYARWEARRIEEWSARDIPFWRDLLAEAPPRILPAPNAAQAGRREHGTVLDAPTVSRVQDGIRAARSIPLSALLHGTARAVGQVFAVDDVVLATISSGRFERRYDAVVGCFVNPVVLPLREVGKSDSAEGVARANRLVLRALRRARTPFDEIARALGGRVDVAGFFDVMVALQAPEPAGSFDDAEITFRPVRVRAPRAGYGLIVEVEPRHDGAWALTARWREDLVEEDAGRAVVAALEEHLMSLGT